MKKARKQIACEPFHHRLSCLFHRNRTGATERHERSAGEAALARALHHPVVTGAIVGIRNAEQLAGNIGGMEFRLSEDEVANIEATA